MLKELFTETLCILFEKVKSDGIDMFLVCEHMH